MSLPMPGTRALTSGPRRDSIHAYRGADRQQSHQCILWRCQQDSEQFGAVLRQALTRSLLQFGQRHSGEGFQPARGQGFQPVLLGQAQAQWQTLPTAIPLL